MSRGSCETVPSPVDHVLEDYHVDSCHTHQLHEAQAFATQPIGSHPRGLGCWQTPSTSEAQGGVVDNVPNVVSLRWKLMDLGFRVQGLEGQTGVEVDGESRFPTVPSRQMSLSRRFLSDA